MDDRALVAQTGLLKALGGGNGKSDVFGIALEKGTRDAMGHLTGPRSAKRAAMRAWLKSLGAGAAARRVGPRPGTDRTNGIGGGSPATATEKAACAARRTARSALGPGKPEVVGSIDPELIVRSCTTTGPRSGTATRRSSPPAEPRGQAVSAWTIDPAGR